MCVVYMYIYVCVYIYTHIFAKINGDQKNYSHFSVLKFNGTNLSIQ